MDPEIVIAQTTSDDEEQAKAADGGTISDHLARMVDELGSELIGDCGYSSVGAVVGATFPEEAAELRQRMPKAVVLVPGYGAQGGTARDAVANFNPDGLGAVVNASRSITYDGHTRDLGEADLGIHIRENAQRMIDDVATALAEHGKA